MVNLPENLHGYLFASRCYLPQIESGLFIGSKHISSLIFLHIFPYLNTNSMMNCQNVAESVTSCHMMLTCQNRQTY